MTDPTDTMARTIYGEARGEPRLGQVAVGWVIRNRSDMWHKTVPEVCQAPLQFSCWNVGDPNRAKLLAVTTRDPVFVGCLKIAGDVIAGNVPDPTNGATNYHAIGCDPSWADKMVQCAAIGNHIFYRD